GSEDAFQAGLRSSVKPTVGVYLVIAYGPSESVCARSCALSGRYCWYSTGRAEAKPIVRMYMKSDAGCSSLKTTVDGLGADTPASGWEETKALIASTGGFFSLANASQYPFIPTIVDVKYAGAPTGETGLQSILNSRTKSSATTGRGGELFHITSGRRWK